MTARRVMVAAAGIIGVAFTSHAFRRSLANGASAADRGVEPDAVAVFPFAVHGSRRELVDIGGAVEDLVTLAMAGGPRGTSVLDPATVRATLRQSRPSLDGIVPRNVSLSVGDRLGVAQLVHGVVSGTPDELSIEGELVALPGGAVQARAEARGTADSLPQLTERLVARLLAAEAARDSSELAALTATSPAALRAYLAGQHAYRRGKWGTPSEANEHFERAALLDSTFALAGLRVAEVAAVSGMAELDERWKLDSIWSRRHRLGPADRALLEAYLGPRYPRPTTLGELITAGERATQVAPHRAEAWHIAGLNLFRFGSVTDYPAWEARATEAWGRALALDSTNAIALDYLVRLAASAGDRDAVRRYAERYVVHNPDGYRRESLRWLAAVMLGDSADLAALRSQMDQMSRQNLRALVEWSPELGVGLEDADRAARLFETGDKSVGGGRTVIVAIVPFMLNRGRPGEASRLLAAAERGFGQRADVGVLEFRIYAALHWDGDSSEAATAARSIEAYLDGGPVRVGQVRDRQTASCALAHWRLAGGDLTGAEMALQEMRQPSAIARPPSVESTPTCAAAGEALLADALHRPDAGAALERLDRLLRGGSDVRQMVPTIANLVAARLHERRGDLRGALAMVRRRGGWTNQLVSTQLREEGRLAALVGDTAAAVRAYRHYLALRSDPEPALRPELDRVRAEIKRLERVDD